ncbi:hypothetical protein ACRRTK_014005 [Alexandromys fortis]
MVVNNWLLSTAYITSSSCLNETSQMGFLKIPCVVLAFSCFVLERRSQDGTD